VISLRTEPLIKMKTAKIFWCTGMSGAGKTTLASHAKIELKNNDFKVLIIDGDVVRKKYDVQLGFNRADVEKNNLNIVEICQNERGKYDCIIVPIISPIDTVRCSVRKLLSPDFHLIYLYANLASLRGRDPKGLYKKADQGIIKDLIGYSSSNLYDDPKNFDLKIDTSTESDLLSSKNIFTNFIMNKMFTASALS
jgi:adenylylsulfate kinase